MANYQVVIGTGARGIVYGRGVLRLTKLLLRRLRYGSGGRNARQNYGKSNLSKVHCSPRNLNYPMRPKRGQKPNASRFQSLGTPTGRMQTGAKTLKAADVKTPFLRTLARTLTIRTATSPTRTANQR